MKIYDVTLAAGVAMNIPLPGRYFRILEGAGTFQIQFDNGVQTEFVAGLGIQLEPFNWAMLTSPTSQVVTVAVSDLRIDDNRLAGVVSVVNGEITNVLAGRAFSAMHGGSGAAGKYPVTQLFNPAGSGVNIVVSRVSLRLTTAAGTGFMMRRYDTLIDTVPTYGGPQYGQSKVVGGANGVGEVRYDVVDSVAGYTAKRIMSGGVPQQYGMAEVPFAEPLVLTPGVGVLCYANLQSAGIDVTYQWLEVPE